MARKEKPNQIVHRLINEERRRKGLPWARWSQKLYLLAKDQANAMAREGHLFHSNRYALQGGENCWMGKGYSERALPKAIVGSWMKSRAGHREWLLDPRVKTAGTAISRSRHGIFAAWAFSDQPLHKPFKLKLPSLKFGKVKGGEGMLRLPVKIILICVSALAFILGAHGLYVYFSPIEAIFGGVLAQLELDYSEHADLARGFLTGLGTTELARINEKFAASLATQTQQLVDRGLFSSAVILDITERNTRDKDEEIAALNDRLNREKLANQHTLYGQQVALRGQTLAGKERLHALAQEVLRYRQAQTMGNAAAETSHRSRAIAEMMGISMARLQGLQGRHEDNMRLMAYQLEERNKLLIGLYGFVERREDVGPKFEELARLATGLGDSGGGWITP